MERQTIYNIFGFLFSLIVANSGIAALKTNPEIWPIGTSLIINAFIMIYFLYYISDINKNKEEIISLKKQALLIKEKQELDEKLLNTIKDIQLLKKK